MTHRVFIGVWLAFVLGGACFFQGSRNVRLKRVILPWFGFFGGGLFVLVVVLQTGRFWDITFVVPIVALIIFLNLRLIKFCNACGATLTQNWLRPMHVCPKCDASLSEVSRRQVGEGQES